MKACKDSVESSQFLGSFLSRKKLTEKDKKKYGELMIQGCPDKSQLSLLTQNNIEDINLRKQKIDSLLKDESICKFIILLINHFKENPHYACFISLFQLGGMIRKKIDQIEKSYKSTLAWIEKQSGEDTNQDPKKMEKIEKAKVNQPIIWFSNELSPDSPNSSPDDATYLYCRTTKGTVKCNKAETCSLFRGMIRTYFNNIFIETNTINREEALSELQKLAFKALLKDPTHIELTCGDSPYDFILNYIQVHNWCYQSSTKLNEMDEYFMSGVYLSF